MIDPSETLLQTLPLPRRLALSYAPRKGRGPVLALLALDVRLAGIIRSSHEPMLAQIRLAWWREQLASNGSTWPEGEPLLAALRSWSGRHGALSPLVDGWEAMTGAAPLDASAFEQLARARAEAFAALASGPAEVKARRLAHNWALADIVSHLADPREKTAAEALMRARDWRGARLPARLRPLAVLHVLAARGLRRDETANRITPGDLAAAMRVGLIGF